MYTQRKLALMIGILAALFLATSGLVVFAAPQSQTISPPSDDGFASGFGSYDDYWLFASWAAFPADKPSSYIIMKFNLATMTSGWPTGDVIEQARLGVATLPVCSPGDNSLTMSLYGMPDSFDGWTEAALPTFAATETAAASATLLKGAADEGAVNGGGTTSLAYHWTDTGAGTFASWLQTQRTSGANPGVVTLMLRLTGPAETAITFDDREHSSGCSESRGAPALEITGGGQALAVTLSSYNSSNAGPNWLLIAAAGLLGLALIVSVIIYRKRAAVRA